MTVQTSGCKVAGAPCKLLLMPELPDIAAYISALEPLIVGQPLLRSKTGKRLSPSNGTTAACERGGSRRARTAPHRQARSHWSRRRSLAGASSYDCRATPLATARGEAERPQQSGSLRLPQWFSRPHRSRHEAPRFVAHPKWRGGSAGQSIPAASTSSPATSARSALRLQRRIALSKEL